MFPPTLAILHPSIGVPGHSLTWFSNYLLDRMQCVKLEQLLSQPLPVTKGVPQESILGNGIACFADDTVLCALGPSTDAVLT